ncbi:putative sarcosine oxidase [Aaosphaeria arxii CBS 175.79]|uniref:Putative sarcosine oxidase n=1 Tax=Aaosphaeria arxii CBS 175.79 TaxID=1450172 RepID=A0A6A5X7L2_9PLEO|nr:putative sarcosine oxidase [Aaosphaeria arxii CBS 175.79]KAF2008879.1 putative sarcosine oxidase [Aaosphaeria arxii CBS 175.79]
MPHALSTQQRHEPVIIVGCGIFGLSTALHLARRGYSNVTVFDRQPCDELRYSYLNGAEGASADMNKIIRSAYGGQSEYQALSTEAIAAWRSWNEELATAATLPPGMSQGDRVFVPNGNISMSTAQELPPWEVACIEGMQAAGHEDKMLDTTNPRHCKIADSIGMAFAIDPFQRKRQGKPNVGVLDVTGGMAVADKACRFALHKAKALGVDFVFGAPQGQFESLCYDSKEKEKVVGIRTMDGKTHTAAMTIVACGGWTPVLLPQLDGLCEATAGSVVLLKIPRSSPLWDRLLPENFPTWTWDIRNGAKGGLYGFPIDENGWLKIGYRGTKYTNPLKHGDGKERSTPATRWSPAHRDGKEPVGEKLTDIPKQAYRVITQFLDEYLPQLAAEGIEISKTRICWYTDTYDNHFVIDYVPQTRGLMVATGGSGHAFKYLPNIGNWVVDIMEGVDLSRPAVRAWKWRQPDSASQPINELMSGSRGSRAWGNIPVVKESQLNSGTRSRL